MPDDDTLSVPVEDLKRGGVRLEELGASWRNIYGTLSAKKDQYGDRLGGDGPIGAEFNKNYYPAADALMKVFKGIGDLVDTHGGKTKDLGALFEDVNNATTDEADQSGGRR